MRTLVLTVPPADAEVAADRLWVAGARAVEEREGPRHVELRTVLAADDGVSRRRLGAVPTTWSVSFVDVDPAPAETWREQARAISVSPDLVIRPAWVDVATASGVIQVVIEPGGSFGLGDHPTTRLMAAAVRRLIRTGDRVLDVGCGSGVLAVIAALGGASVVEAIDIAEAAREATEDNATRNGVEAIVQASTRDLAAVTGEFDVVLANILAPTLVALSADLRRVTRPAGVLVISGILDDRHDHVLDALHPLVAVADHELDGWVAVELRHPPASAVE